MLQQVLKEGFSFFGNRREQKVQHVSALLKRMSVLLEEGYTFSDAITMLLPYHVKNVETWYHNIQQQFSNGCSVVDILQQFSIPKHFLIMIQIAEEKGDLSETLQHIAKQMEFSEQMQKRVGKLVMYPAFLIVILTVVFALFRTYFLPNIKQIASSSHTSLASFHFSTLLLHLPDIFLYIFFMMVCICFLFISFLKKREVQEQINIFLKLPIVRYVYKITVTRQFSRLLGSLLVAGFSLQQALTILEEQKWSRHLSYITVMLKKRVIYGDSLYDAVNILQVFARNFEQFIKHGEKSGHLGRELLIYSELLDERIQSMLKIVIACIQPFFFIIIAICILAAYLSMLLPMYDLVNIL